MGKQADLASWQDLQEQYPQVPVTCLGLFDTPGLRAILRNRRTLIMIPRWVEAVGNVAIEALAGASVIAYHCGDPIEIVHHGKIGGWSQIGWRVWLR